jgi:hypothetical protein
VLAAAIVFGAVFFGYEIWDIQSLKQACVNKIVQEESTFALHLAPGSSEQSITEFRTALSQTQYFDNILYESAQDAERAYREKYANDQLAIQALNLTPNGASASLVVQIRDIAKINTVDKWNAFYKELESISKTSGIVSMNANSVPVSNLERQISDIKNYSLLLDIESLINPVAREQKNTLEHCVNQTVLTY